MGVFILHDIYNKKTDMNKKIILRESQYKRFISLLFENTKINNILNNVQSDNILNIVDDNGNDNKIKVISVDDNVIKGEDENGVKVVLNIDDYDDTIKKITFNKINPNTQQPIEVTMSIKDIEIIHDEEENISNFEELDDDKQFKNYYNDILSDPILKKAFYTTPTLWNYFTSALKNKKARGTGILPAYDIINKYYKTKIDNKFTGFTNKENKRAVFYLFEDVEIPYYQINDNTNRKIMTIEHGHLRATVRQYEAGLGDVKLLTYRSSGGNYGFKIVVKKQIDGNSDLYFCDIYVNNNKVQENKYKIENVKIKFLNSEGYSSYNNIKKIN